MALKCQRRRLDGYLVRIGTAAARDHPREAASLLRMPRYVLQYESADDVRAKAPLHFAAHKARWREFLDQGTLLMIGTFSDLEGSMAVFSTREAAEEFARSDPFVLNRVVSSWRIREWNEAIT
jgi:uncharacterized protein YciI